jgi:hypothetical protein
VVKGDKDTFVSKVSEEYNGGREQQCNTIANFAVNKTVKRPTENCRGYYYSDNFTKHVLTFEPRKETKKWTELIGN